jgi:hypothetical protein
MTRHHYTHMFHPELTVAMSEEPIVRLDGFPNLDVELLTRVAIHGALLARRIGIRIPEPWDKDSLPYESESDQTVFMAPGMSALLGQPIAFLRGWSKFESCVKGFNALGLMGEQVLNIYEQLKSSDALLQETAEAFLAARGLSLAAGQPENHFLGTVSSSQLETYDLAIWKAFAKKSIICSTSSNMGISLHDALRSLQAATVKVGEQEVPLLSQDEGSLVIWCPDPRADFMNAEKTAFLEGIAAEQPSLTRLRTYINRQQRDPGALSDALNCGGYFFPTNPQSAEEMVTLIYFGLEERAKAANLSIAEILQNQDVLDTLTTLGCSVDNSRVFVRRGVEGGLGGLMLPYFLMMAELSSHKEIHSACIWNQASIGAALAAAVLAEQVLTGRIRLTESTWFELEGLFPSLRSQFLRNSADSDRTIHGVFDLANIQSLAQLLGVVVTNHTSGKGTAFVGLGSASYSNGNRCFEILKEDHLSNGAFRGESTFHPATHTLNPVAQALVLGEDLMRALGQLGEECDEVEILRHVRKPEPAGAAALAGYLLDRLDQGTLSVIEIGFALRRLGIDRNCFLWICGFPQTLEGEQMYIRFAGEEGTRMAQFASDLLTSLQWDPIELHRLAVTERDSSNIKQLLGGQATLGCSDAENLQFIYLTGDNTAQPSSTEIQQLIRSLLSFRSAVAGVSPPAATNSRVKKIRRMNRRYSRRRARLEAKLVAGRMAHEEDLRRALSETS